MSSVKSKLESEPNGNGKILRERLERHALKSDDPTLWRNKYNFYVEELKLTPEQAINWADNAVQAIMEARVEFEFTKARRNNSHSRSNQYV